MEDDTLHDGEDDKERHLGEVARAYCPGIGKCEGYLQNVEDDRDFLTVLSRIADTAFTM